MNNNLKKLVNKSNLQKQSKDFEILESLKNITGGLSAYVKGCLKDIIIFDFNTTCPIHNTGCDQSCTK
jgi:hypothetical protein